jgi:hypothetical protein
MATRHAISRLTGRIEALAARRWHRRTLDSLTDGAWAKLREIAAPDDGPCTPIGAARQWSDNDLIAFLVDGGVLTAADFKGANGHAPGEARQ